MKKTDKGVSLLEVLLVIGIMVMVIPKVYENIENHLNNVRWQNAAEHANTYNTAVRNYVADNASTLLAGSLPKTITPATLIQKGYLKSGFSESNFGQSYITGIAKNSKTSRLEALTCSNGGQSLSEAGMRSVASMIEGLGGYINSSKQAIGAGGGWSDTPSNYGLNCATGHIAMALVGADLQESDRLYRYSITNRPDLNRMHTAIDMNSNNLNNVGTLNGNAAALSGDISARNGTFSGAISGNTATTNGDITSNNGWLVTKNSKGWMNSTYGGGWYMSDSSWLRSVNNKGIYTGGQVKGGTVRADGRLYTGEYLQLEKTATAGASCSPNGLVGRDSTGAILSCQSGVWRTSGSSNGSYSNLGSHRGSFTGRNTGSGTLFVYASGGNGGSAGGDCANTSRLQGYVAGVLISTNASNNPSYGKTAFISFAVPAGATYQITSYPAQNYSCGSGVFSVFGYQT
ncbi:MULTISPECIES: shufflon system plasmid conjugative transfer pilus tip adhesin PilV [Enterobacteriaceae]|uniref:shufflon system plasmid conjugative transfer pilus tip adhesin PilV n=1 Tax=Enterobacteriaceae TaxID=543 RepID=UPI0006A553D0|nr:MULTISPECIES: shufflon system plasmid conjugative transfer pilus tip adhesin PilV [Enterobacteriaceae]EAB4197480.1 shufflon system plasmid conjugative transfer pilus tip adhesin PilV [Salmonella enterica]ECH6713449.1 shufflon system plasmid conjugative transfer pilus tip adhesin PilV [Salmonella enterica subsp. enterica serovar Weltevreden]ECJ4569457.1 shufflon system plasmid conjugative transfer pilus tip adhesin PilV [Salmonella enterica subsp. enterica serovar Javiana]EGZ6904198.1 shufflo